MTDSNCWCTLEPAIAGELPLLAQPVVVECREVRRSALVVENSVSTVLSPVKSLLDNLMRSEEVFQYGTCPLFCLAGLGQCRGLPFRAMRFNRYTLPIPLLTSTPVFITLSSRIANMS